MDQNNPVEDHGQCHMRWKVSADHQLSKKVERMKQWRWFSSWLKKRHNFTMTWENSLIYQSSTFNLNPKARANKITQQLRTWKRSSRLYQQSCPTRLTQPNAWQTQKAPGLTSQKYSPPKQEYTHELTLQMIKRQPPCHQHGQELYPQCSQTFTLSGRTSHQ